MRQCTIHKVTEEGNDIRAVQIKVEEGLNFIPGQYIMISMREEPENFHCFSIVNYDSQGKIVTIAYKKIGHFTSMLFGKKEGTILNLKGPYGRFVLPDSQPDVALIAGGVGVTPIYCMLINAVKSNYKGRIYFFYSGRTTRDMPFFPALYQLRSERLKSVFYLTEEQKEGTLNRRMAADDVKEIIPDYRRCIYFICGPPPMMDALKEGFNKIGIPPDNVRIEIFK